MERVVLLPVLICPIVMGGMMVWMMRQVRSGGSDAERKHEADRR